MYDNASGGNKNTVGEVLASAEFNARSKRGNVDVRASETNPRKATGVDGISKDRYDENAVSNIGELVRRMRKFEYKPKPVKRVYIPKANGKLRPLGLPSYEDKLVQGVMAGVLNEVYEERFLDCSYGFREKRSAHDVVKYINRTIIDLLGNWRSAV